MKMPTHGQLNNMLNEWSYILGEDTIIECSNECHPFQMLMEDSANHDDDCTDICSKKELIIVITVVNHAVADHDIAPPAGPHYDQIMAAVNELQTEMTQAYARQLIHRFMPGNHGLN
jgi:hypothetical protein